MPAFSVKLQEIRDSLYSLENHAQKIANCSVRINNVFDSATAGPRYESLSLVLLRLRKLSQEAENNSKSVISMQSNLRACANAYEQAERVAASANYSSSSTNESKIAGAVGAVAGASKHGDLMTAAAVGAVTGITAGDKYANWGNGTKGVIRPIEYARLCYYANQFTNNKKYPIGSEDRAMKDLLAAIKKEFPKDHPISRLTKEDISILHAGDKGETEALVFKISDKDAIVVFAGTDLSANKADLKTDALIAAELPVKQAENASVILEAVERAGYSNIHVAGHSLGGYLASSQNWRPSVKEVMTFDAPGLNKTYAALTNVFRSENASKVVNYLSIDSVVNWPGNHVGAVDFINLKGFGYSNGNNAGPLPGHSIDAICRYFADGASISDALAQV